MTAPAAQADYTTRDVARLLDLPARDVRSLARTGLVEGRVSGRGGYRFSFQDLVLLRAAKELREARIPRRRIRAALDRLRERLPAGGSLSSVRLSADGGRVLAREGSALWDAESRQGMLDFETCHEGGARAAPRVASRAPATAVLSQETDAPWFERGRELEEAGDGEGAAASYRRALERAPDDADAHLNLGCLLHEQGRGDEALEHYRRSLALRPDSAEAAFDLAVALEDLGRLEEAASAYRDLLSARPDYADAHYNLAGVYEKLGRRAEAFQELKEYRRLSR